MKKKLKSTATEPVTIKVKKEKLTRTDLEKALEEKEKEMKGNFITLMITLIVILVFLFVAVTCMNLTRRRLEKELEFYKEDSLREGIIVMVTDTCVYVADEMTQKIIEVDIFDELIHTTIEVGDTAVYVVDYKYTDADLINIIKKGE